MNAQTVIIWFATGFKFKGIMVDRMRKFFKRPIALSTCIRNRAMLFVLMMSLPASLFPLPQLHFFVNGGISNYETSVTHNLISWFHKVKKATLFSDVTI